jgi:hypothetical protein
MVRIAKDDTIYPPVQLQFIEHYTQEQMRTLEVILFLSTLGHSIYIMPYGNYYVNIVKSILTFFITCRTMAIYLQRAASNQVSFLICFWICYGIINNFIDNYIIIVETITNNNYE